MVKTIQFKHLVNLYGCCINARFGSTEERRLTSLIIQKKPKV